MKKVIILSAPSGSGKTTIAKRLLAANPGLEFSVSACSRSKRPGEMDGRDYFFLTTKDFQEKIDSGEFIEWEEVYPGHYYGTLRSEIERIWSAGKTVLFDVDVVGGSTLKKIFKEKALSVFILPPDLETLRQRLINRSSDDEEKIRMRLNKAEMEINMAGGFDLKVVNDDLDEAVKAVDMAVMKFLSE